MNPVGRLLVLALVVAGSAIPAASAQTARFGYDRGLPLDLRVLSSEDNRLTVVRTVSFAVTRSTRATADLVTPKRPGKHPAILFVPGRRATRAFFLREARREAARGAVALSLDDLSRGYPTFTRADLAKLTLRIVALRRAIDLLVARPDVDARRLGFVGHSDGAELGGMLAGVDRRIACFALMSGGGIWDRSSEPAYNSAIAAFDADNYIAAARPAPLLLQSGLLDTIVPRADMQRFARLASAPKQIRWYRAPHTLNERARADRDAWLEQRLGMS